MRKYVFALAFLILFGSVIIFTSEKDETLDPRLSASCTDCNVILVSIDTLRADHLGVYGYGRDTSPAIDLFTENAIVFENAIAQAPWTLPSHVSMLTGLYSTRHGVVNMAPQIPNSTLTLADILHEMGYKTYAFTDGGYVAKRFNYHTFDVFDDTGDHNGRNYGKMINWLGNHSNETFFLFWHDYQPHYPYAPPEEYDVFSDENYSGIVNTFPGEDDQVCDEINVSVEREWCNTKTGYYYNLILDNLTEDDLAHVKDMYDGEILAVDAKFQGLVNLLEERGILDKTLIVFTSDHGESFAERDSHKRIGHTLMYEEVLRVPLIIKVPSMRKQIRVAPVVESIDIMPTVLDLLGLGVPAGLDGESLIKRVGDDSAYSENFGEGGDMDDYSIRNGNLKLIFYKRMENPEFRERRKKDEYEFYNLGKDPLEQKNIYGLNTSDETQLNEMLYAKIQGNMNITEKANLDEETIKRLQNLGYLAGKHA